MFKESGTQFLNNRVPDSNKKSGTRFWLTNRVPHVSSYFENKILMAKFGELFNDYFNRVGFLLIFQTDQRKP